MPIGLAGLCLDLGQLLKLKIPVEIATGQGGATLLENPATELVKYPGPEEAEGETL